MTTPVRRLATAVLAPLVGLALAGPASADQAVVQFKFAHDRAPAGPPTTPEAATAASKAPTADEGVSKGVPGLFDPATRTFKPLSSKPDAAASPAYSGTVSASVHISAESGIGPDDTVSCRLTVMFGTVAGSPPQYFPTHSVSTTANFAAGEPVQVIDAPFSYTPTAAGNPVMRLGLQCQVNFASDGTAHQSSETLAVQPIATTTVSFNLTL